MFPQSLAIDSTVSSVLGAVKFFECNSSDSQDSLAPLLYCHSSLADRLSDNQLLVLGKLM